MTTRLDDVTLARLGFPILRADVDQRRRNLVYDRAILADCALSRALSGEAGEFPLGWYTLPDGRLVRGLTHLELTVSVRESWRLQRAADALLSARLDADRPVVAVPPSVLQNRLFE